MTKTPIIIFEDDGTPKYEEVDKETYKELLKENKHVHPDNRL